MCMCGCGNVKIYAGVVPVGVPGSSWPYCGGLVIIGFLQAAHPFRRVSLCTGGLTCYCLTSLGLWFPWRTVCCWFWGAFGLLALVASYPHQYGQNHCWHTAKGCSKLLYCYITY